MMFLMIKLINCVCHPTNPEIAACPENLAFAPKDAMCLNFKFDIDTGDLTPEIVESFRSKLVKAIDEEGLLYDRVLSLYPETLVTGLGSPGKGIDYTTPTYDTDKSDPSGATEAEVGDTTSESSGLSSGAIVGIILVVLVVPMAAMAMFARYRQEQEKERLARLAEYEEAHGRSVPLAVGAGDDEDSIYSETRDSDFKKKGTGAGSALAAMGTAGATAALLQRKGSE